ncbi:hypothetical protein CEXT_670741 [Caerostris extrusa]|uniref:Uncharacterized protein n=1 Tax=Caerostris extrusa TaxID=172846 RepID=A0AAV4U764_CAEEX|nr:hypothetical protein CEXT_670741 [Caerostris extrusa]
MSDYGNHVPTHSYQNSKGIKKRRGKRDSWRENSQSLWLNERCYSCRTHHKARGTVGDRFWLLGGHKLQAYLRICVCGNKLSIGVSKRKITFTLQ